MQEYILLANIMVQVLASFIAKIPFNFVSNIFSNLHMGITFEDT